MASSASDAIASSSIGIQDDVFVAVGQPLATPSVAGTADGKGGGEGPGSDVYGRPESSETQPMGAGGTNGESGGALEMKMMTTTPSSETEADDSGNAGSGSIVSGPPALVLPSTTIGEGSTTPHTDVE